MSNTTADTVPCCTGCMRMRAKLEDHLAVQGLVECRLKEVDAGLIMEAFYEFAATKQSTRPFAVTAKPGAVAAWPFQFHPDTIASCAGHMPIQAQQ